MRLKLFLSILFFCGIAKAQTNTELKDFINKNNSILKSVQKNMLRENNLNYINTFKELLKNQEAAINVYNTNKDASSHFAFIVRNECLDFLKKHSQAFPENYKITSIEQPLLKPSSQKNIQALSLKELKAIEELDAYNPKIFNDLTLTIQ